MATPAPAVEYRIKNLSAILMITFAIFVDAIQFLLTLTVVGSVICGVIAAAAFVIFLLWFMFHKVSYFDRGAAKKMLTVIMTAVVELVPILDALPGTTLGVVALIAFSRDEDRKKAGEGEAARKKAAEKQAAVLARYAQMQKKRVQEEYLAATEAASGQEF